MAWIEKRGNKYRVYWDVGTPDDRKRRMEPFDTPEEADQFKKKIEYEASIGLCFDPSKMTFGEYLDHWLKIHGDKLAPKTLVSYECEIKNHIKPKLGQLKLTKLTPMHLQNYYAFLLKEGRASIAKRRLEALSDHKKPKNENTQRAKKRAEASLKKMELEGTMGPMSLS